MNLKKFKEILDKEYVRFESGAFIESDPVCVPHAYAKKQDIEISGLFAATIAWGQRTTIISNAKRLMQLMDNAPHDFIVNHHDRDLKRFEGFVHRTFQYEDLLYFIYFLNDFYKKNDSLELAFFPGKPSKEDAIRNGLLHFREIFFDMRHVSERTKKHVSTPARNSACKRLNMFLRWMVRKDHVDFGIWKRVSASELICPMDVHVHKVVSEFHVLKNKKPDWNAAVELTEMLRGFDAVDPVKYDFALFELGRKMIRKP